VQTYPYTTVPGRIRELLEKMRSVGVPEKASAGWLPLIGFKASNDRTMLGVLKFIGFIGPGGKPSDLWRQYRGPDHENVLANALREAYPSLFQTYESPCSLTANELRDFFSVQTGAAKGTISKMVDTFKALCSMAAFSKSLPVAEIRQTPSAISGRSVNVNINIELPVTDDEKVYERIFKALKEHLLD